MNTSLAHQTPLYFTKLKAPFTTVYMDKIKFEGSNTVGNKILPSPLPSVLLSFSLSSRPLCSLYGWQSGFREPLASMLFHKYPLHLVNHWLCSGEGIMQTFPLHEFMFSRIQSSKKKTNGGFGHYR